MNNPIKRVWNWLRGKPRSRSAAPTSARPIRARYDAAQTTEENRRHWSNADNLSANAENTPGVRRTLRNRARYEVQNNSYAQGLVATMAHDLIGTGPRLSLSIPGVSEEQAGLVEAAFARWARRANLAEKLRVWHESRIRDGESFAQFVTNPAFSETGVQLDLRVIEADQVETPDLDPFDTQHVDGIRYDDAGNPIEYHILAAHPADNRGLRPWGQYARVPASHVLHWFRPTRPGQARGIPEITSVLPLFAQLRRYTQAVLTAAETAAMIAGVMYTDQPAFNADGEAADAPVSFDRIELERGALLTAPNGWKAEGFDATQPTTTYESFKAEILNEIGRCVNVPFNVVAGNSSKYNYSSGRLDHAIYHRTVWVERERLRNVALDRVFLAWYAEARLIPGMLPEGLPDYRTWAWEWHWDSFLSIDPALEATANAANLAAGLTTLAEIYAGNGQDWKEALKQRAREIEFAKTLGVSAGGA